MNSYLAIAEEALRRAKRPLTSREIVEVAYRLDLVPSRLFGRTQHKTVGARLSEDILALRDRSHFYRSEPGKFFLREFLSDPSIPEAHRSPIVARRRQRELRRGVPLKVMGEVARDAVRADAKPDEVLASIAAHSGFFYSDASQSPAMAIWAFVMFIRGTEVLTYRHGRYREGRDSFLKRRSVGFFTPVFDRDLDLFDEGDHGIIASGLRAIAFDLDLPHVVFNHEYKSKVRLSDFVIPVAGRGAGELLAVVDVECPKHFEPLTRRLAINDLYWMPFNVPVNHIEDFDPWSQAVMARCLRRSNGASPL